MLTMYIECINVLDVHWKKAEHLTQFKLSSIGMAIGKVAAEVASITCLCVDLEDFYNDKPNNLKVIAP